MKTQEKIICNCCKKVILECYDMLVRSFQIPVKSQEVTELI